MKRVTKKQTKDLIAEEIKSSIITGDIDEDADITQEELAELLGVSRMPVREAIQTLIDEGFMEKLQNRRVRVIKLSAEQITDVFKCIASFEYDIFELFIKKQYDKVSYEDIKNAIINENSFEKVVELEIMFHENVNKCIENKYLTLMFNKMFFGYPIYAINNYGDISDKKRFVVKLIDSILCEDIIEFKKIINEYYFFYAIKFN